MDKGLEALSETIIWSKYSKYLPECGRRETWDEIITRYENMLVKKYPILQEEIVKNTQFIRDKKVLPSMRALQFAGAAMEVNNGRGYNCAYLPIDSYHSFSETMFLLLGGSGVGYSVQKHHVDKLPPIKIPTKTRKFLVQDSIIGWADAIKALIKAYLDEHSLPIFDFRDIRPKGARLVTAGGKAPGPEPLRLCLAHIKAILDRKKDGEKLTPLECHDIQCHIANGVLAGGIRRSAMISLFSHDDEEMITCKYGNWWELNEQRGRANNSAVLERSKTSKEEFLNLWKRIELSGSGEPGIYWTNNKDWGTNPCCEIGLRPFQFCNLCEINANDIISQKDLNERAKIAAFFGTLQAGFTDFHYLRSIWQKTTEKDVLLGIGMTGIASGRVLTLNLSAAVELAKEENQKIAKVININPAARLTCVKPSGTTSCVLGSSSGIHAWYAKYYLRTVRFGLDEEISKYLLKTNPDICEKDLLRPHDTLCVRFPIKSPETGILRTETAIDTLNRVKKFSIEWVNPGHIMGDNTHNVSATISIDKNRLYSKGLICVGDGEWLNLESKNSLSNEWEAVGEWMWQNKEYYNGLSVLPYDGGTYTQAPFEEINEQEYNTRSNLVKFINLEEIIENEDNVNFGQTAACAGGACEII